MRTIFAVLISFLLLSPAALADDDMIVKKSAHSVAETLDRLTASLEEQGITIFARIDHAAGAKGIGESLRPTQVLIFGNPKLGTPLMQANQRIGLDLPMKVLAWEDAEGTVWLGYLEPDELEDRYDLEDENEIFKKIAGALEKFTSAAVKAQ